MAPSAVELVSAGVAGYSSGSAASSSSDAASQSIIERGAVAHWEGFEAVCYDILYNQVLPCLTGSSLMPLWWTHQLVQNAHQLTCFLLCSLVGSRATRAACLSRSPFSHPRRTPRHTSCLGMHL